MGAVWVTNALDGTVSRIDPVTKTVAQTIHVGNGPEAVAAGSGAIWVANSRDGTVSRIDPQTNSVTANKPEPETSRRTSASRAARSGWRTSSTARLRSSTRERERPNARGTSAIFPKRSRQPLGWFGSPSRAPAEHTECGTLAISVPLVDLDTGYAYDAFSWVLFINTNDGLTGFKRVGGSEGTQVVPDLADALATPTDDGKRYTFRLRARIRYSTGALVHASDFRRAIERLFRIQSPGAGFFTNLLGGAACAARPARCDLTRGIVTDDASGTLVFRLHVADPELLYKLALPFAYPVPVGTPNVHEARRPIPGTGPYAIANVGKRELRFVRNRYFRVVESGATGRLSGRDPGEGERRDGSGHSCGRTRQARLGRVRNLGAEAASRVACPVPSAGPGQRVSRNEFHGLEHTPASIRRPESPTGAQLRRRPQRVGHARRRPACGAADVPGAAAELPGFRTYCPFKAPDLKRARELVTASGTKGTKVVVYTMSGYFERFGRYFVSVLRRLGYRASLAHRPIDTYFVTISDTRNHVQIAFDNWIADYPAASDFINVLLSCRSFHPASPANGNRAGFCDRKIDAQIGRALSLQASSPDAVGPLWAQIDHEIVDQAPWVPMTNPKAIDFVSERVGGYQYNPQWGMLIDQLWVR